MTKYDCSACSREFFSDELFGETMICEGCLRDAINDLWEQRSGEKHPDFMTDEDREERRKKRVARTGKAFISQTLRRQVFERDAYRCRQCEGFERLQCDHVIPESKGGPTTLDNLQTLCRKCNMIKGAKA